MLFFSVVTRLKHDPSYRGKNFISMIDLKGNKIYFEFARESIYQGFALAGVDYSVVSVSGHVVRATSSRKRHRKALKASNFS